MAQHLWMGSFNARVCEVCHAMQSAVRGDWAPLVSAICASDDDDGGRRKRPLAEPGVT